MVSEFFFISKWIPSLTIFWTNEKKKTKKRRQCSSIVWSCEQITSNRVKIRWKLTSICLRAVKYKFYNPRIQFRSLKMCFRVQFSFSWPENLFCLFFVFTKKIPEKGVLLRKKVFKILIFQIFRCSFLRGQVCHEMPEWNFNIYIELFFWIIT